MTDSLQDLRYAWRQLRKSPGFAVVAVLSLALGMGANTAVFSVMNAVLLRSLPVREPSGLYFVHIGDGQTQPSGASSTGNPSTSFSEPVYEALRARGDVFTALMAYVPLEFNKVAARVGDAPEELWGDEVSGNFFSGLTVPMALGRGFTLAEERSHAPVAVVSYGYWTRRFARHPEALGQTLYVKGVPFSIVGITAPGFQGVEPGVQEDLWIPLQNNPHLNAWGIAPTGNTLYGTPRWWALRLMTRLKPGISAQQAVAAVRPTFGEAAKIGIGPIDPKQWQPVLELAPAKGIEGYNAYRQPLRVLMGLVLLVLAIACVNVALMLMARNAARQREFSLRLAMGAGRLRLLRQLLAEGAMLVGAGTVLGWALAVYATHWLASVAAIETGLNPDRRVLLFTLGVSAVISLAFGLAPVGSALRAPVAEVLRSGGTHLSPGRRRIWNGRAGMTGQIAVGLVLLMASGLLLHTLRNYQRQDLGMRTGGLLAFGITPQGVQGNAATAAFYRTLVERLRGLPGVEAVTLAGNRPGTGWSDNSDLTLDGVEQQNVLLRSNSVGAEFFHTMGIAVLEGRDLELRDMASAPPVVVVNETFAKRFFPHSSPMGHQIGGKERQTIVGVAADSKYTSVDEDPTPMAYYPVLASPQLGPLQVEVRTAGDPVALLPELRQAVRAINPNIPLQQPMTQQAQFEQSYAQPKMFASLGGSFGVLAAVLVATGLYGTLSYRTNQRSTEIGVRMALGARRGQVLWLVLRESLVMFAFGCVLAVPAAYFTLRLLASMLFHLAPFDPLTLGVAAVCLGAVVLAASIVPARRAASVNPMRALRAE